MKITKTLQDLFLSELADAYDSERRIVRALPRMARAATCENLKKALQTHASETEGHIAKLEDVFKAFEAKARGKTCKATLGLVEEADDLAADFKDSPAINAALVSSAQRIEHYEMASYGCLVEWAGLLGNKKAAAILQTILSDEKAANEALTTLARTLCNQQALCASEEVGSQKPAAAAVPKPQRTRPLFGSKPSRLAPLPV